MTANPKEFTPGSWVTVEVYGLPDGKPKTFPYRATYPVHTGESVRVPAPEFVTAMFGETELPGCVMGEVHAPASSDMAIKDIIPVPEQPKAPNRDALRELVKQWRKDAHKLEQDAAVHRVLALAITDRADQLEDALDGELGF